MRLCGRCCVLLSKNAYSCAHAPGRRYCEYLRRLLRAAAPLHDGAADAARAAAAAGRGAPELTPGLRASIAGGLLLEALTGAAAMLLGHDAAAAADLVLPAAAAALRPVCRAAIELVGRAGAPPRRRAAPPPPAGAGDDVSAVLYLEAAAAEAAAARGGSWLLDLYHTLVWLCGRLASRLIVGPPASRSEARLGRWLRTPLIAGGLDEGIVAAEHGSARAAVEADEALCRVVARDWADLCDAVGASAAPAAEGEVVDAASAAAAGERADAAERRGFEASCAAAAAADREGDAPPTACGGPVGGIIAWLDRARAFGAVERRRMEVVPLLEAPLVAALLKHSGLWREARDCAAAGTRPSPDMLQLHAALVGVRKWLRAERNALHQAAEDGKAAAAASAAAAAGIAASPAGAAPASPGSHGGHASIEALLRDATERAAFLAALAPAAALTAARSAAARELLAELTQEDRERAAEAGHGVAGGEGPGADEGGGGGGGGAAEVCGWVVHFLTRAAPAPPELLLAAMSARAVRGARRARGLAALAHALCGARTPSAAAMLASIVRPALYDGGGHALAGARAAGESADAARDAGDVPPSPVAIFRAASAASEAPGAEESKGDDGDAAGGGGGGESREAGGGHDGGDDASAPHRVLAGLSGCPGDVRVRVRRAFEALYAGPLAGDLEGVASRVLPSGDALSAAPPYAALARALAVAWALDFEPDDFVLLARCRVLQVRVRLATCIPIPVCAPHWTTRARVRAFRCAFACVRVHWTTPSRACARRCVFRVRACASQRALQSCARLLSADSRIDAYERLGAPPPLPGAGTDGGGGGDDDAVPAVFRGAAASAGGGPPLLWSRSAVYVAVLTGRLTKLELLHHMRSLGCALPQGVAPGRLLSGAQLTPVGDVLAAFDAAAAARGGVGAVAAAENDRLVVLHGGPYVGVGVPPAVRRAAWSLLRILTFMAAAGGGDAARGGSAGGGGGGGGVSGEGGSAAALLESTGEREGAAAVAALPPPRGTTGGRRGAAYFATLALQRATFDALAGDVATSIAALATARAAGAATGTGGGAAAVAVLEPLEAEARLFSQLVHLCMLLDTPAGALLLSSPDTARLLVRVIAPRAVTGGGGGGACDVAAPSPRCRRAALRGLVLMGPLVTPEAVDGVYGDAGAARGADAGGFMADLLTTAGRLLCVVDPCGGGGSAARAPVLVGPGRASQAFAVRARAGLCVSV